MSAYSFYFFWTMLILQLIGLGMNSASVGIPRKPITRQTIWFNFILSIMYLAACCYMT